MFTDRRDAGRRLAEALRRYQPEQPVVLALPRGGVPIGREIARVLDAPLEVVVVRKIGAPGHPEFAIGAIAHGVTMVNREIVSQLGIPEEHLTRTIERETSELERRDALYRRGRPPVDLTNRTVIVVDDGLATGATATAAVQAIRQRKPRRVIFAAPVCAPDSAAGLRSHADEVVCLETPREFRAVSLWYQDFSPTTDAEVLDCLNQVGPPSQRKPR